ncbi:hypothetical protein DESUT3_13220 [Desulfuromonas versatilis]|uniref:Uncharacterized protein n=1 Tax=Desulfuromonas versatilis TaxID=2802975 RepID=A0ABM8HUS7_9BACT|nr:efflux RND transporter periplasmic adaptor subunit [Desulfuromonas versatilis]BCR04253.1 hypothetical protein DESUT3_13220 [Desulfuromonas versatilis]
MDPAAAIREIHQFPDHPGRFWPAFLEFASGQARAEAAILLTRKRNPGTWKPLSHWPEASRNIPPKLLQAAEKISDAALQKGTAWACVPGAKAGETDLVLFGLRLHQEDAGQDSVAVFVAGGTRDGEKERTLAGLQLLADAPAVYQRERAARRALQQMAAVGETLDMLVLLNAEKNHFAAAMTLVNETAARIGCSRVSLGWLEKGYVRLQAVSHMERFERKMEIVGRLEAAMEEALDQDEEIVLPPGEQSGAVVRDHAQFAAEQGVPYMVSLPIRLDGEPVGVLSCERQQAPFTEKELLGLRVLCDQTARRLGDLKAAGRWWGAKLADALRDKTSALLGVEHTLAKGCALLACLLLAAMIVIKIPYRVEAPFILKSDDVRQVSVPFEGYIDEVHVRIGQQVRQGDLLLSLDSDDLLLEEAAAVANQIRYLREAEKARARGALVDMQIAQAQADQAAAQLELVRYRLGQAQLRSPIDGIVVEGDLEELRGAPVDKGNVLFKVARSENLFAQIRLNERDIHEIAAGQPGQIAFVSQPRLKFAMRMERIDPVAQAGEEGNLFHVRAAPAEAPPGWWRPGMSGIAKVEVGKRRILWIITHRTIDFLRMRLWM